MAFDRSRIINLDQCVLDALTLFTREKPPSLDLGFFKRPLVVGSGNAAATGKIFFEGTDAVFADESTYLKKLEAVPGIDGCILISASGGKHAPLIAGEVRDKGLQVVLLTNNRSAPASKLASKTYVFPKNSEPYTYNTSTYLGMILGKTGEDAAEIRKFLLNLRLPADFGKYDSVFMIVPDEFESAREMFLTKFDELFGPKVSGRVFTLEQAKHAKTVVPSDTELFISLGAKNTQFGKHRLDVPLPKKASYASLIAVGYYVIGRIQAQHPPYFKDSIEAYAASASKIFGQEIKPMVD